MDDYRTVQGDSWDSIALKLYGNDANTEHRFTVLFSAGIILKVPDAPVMPISVNNFPPWRRNSVT